jgi:hypothetical protein
MGAIPLRILRLLFAVLPFAFCLFAAPAGAEPPAAQQMTGGEAAGVVFTEIEKRLIRDYFGGKSGEAEPEKGKNGAKGKSKKMPPGLAKRGTLPPGLQMQLEKNGTLPPGLAKRDLPPDLVSKLPALQPGYKRHIVGNDVVLVQEATGLVLDILKDVLKTP